ncbi:hypothetical protein IGI04_006410 [Brassica rapa subsp. trilocularis]|uniref:Uncharacterized protein n=1 Tax=Brassica rapa subsp. trilocularis TaxID=1813537 RepID=A0ABQ7NIZ3_BRACM|nr:hypothetical protein IGI04_006410 [Brassica rapa subsp. trilocularis]
MQTALEEAKIRLHVTEAEASWWKVTAYIVSKHIGHWRNKECDLMSWRESNTRTRSNIKAVCEIERTRSNIKAAEMRLVTAMKMKEAARAAEAVAIAEIKDVTRRRRTRKMLQEEIPEKIEETAQEIKSNRRTIEEGLETVNSAKMKAGEEETQWQWSERRRRSSSYKGKYKNRRETVLMDENGLDMMMNGDGTASSVTVLKPATSIGQILSRKVLLADESAMMMNGRVSLERNGEGKEKYKRVNGKRKKFGLAKLSVMLNKECKKNKKKKVALNLN